MRRLLALLLCLLIPLGALSETAFPPSSTPVLRGIDVSAWQGEIDWAQVKAAGVEIAYIRASEGSSVVDAAFRRNAVNARAAGVRVGFYHFATAKTPAEAETQAAFFLATIGGYAHDCRLAVDFGETAGLTGAAMSACALAFLRSVTLQTGSAAMLYTDAWAAKARWSSALADYPIWVANYGVAEPEANGKWRVWYGFQYSDRGSVPGITGRVDLDQFTREVLLSPTPPTPTPPSSGQTEHLQLRRAYTPAELAAYLGVSAATLTDLNPAPGGVFPAGLIVRWPGSAATLAFGGFHILQARESLATVARHYGTTEATLRSLNDLTAGAMTGRVLRVPSVRPGVQAPSDSFLAGVVVAAEGETVAVLAARYGLTEEELRRYNGLAEASQLRRGQMLHLSAYGKDSVVGFTGGQVVCQGDALRRIARFYGVDWRALLALNNIASADLLWPGQVLLMPEAG